MSGRLLVVEPDRSTGAVLQQVLAAEGFATVAVGSFQDAIVPLEVGSFDLAIVDERAGNGTILEEVRELRSRYPSLPLIVTGTLLNRRVLQQLIRLEVADTLDKPFTPAELRAAVAGATMRRGSQRREALEYAAAIAMARKAIASGDESNVGTMLARAHAASPLDAETMTLVGLSAELVGNDDNADRAYRAAIALRHEEDAPAPNPRDGLARLLGYKGARPVGNLPSSFAQAPLWVVGDAERDLEQSPPCNGPCLVLLSLGLVPDAVRTLYFRAGERTNAFVLTPSALQPEAVALVAELVKAGPLVATDETRAEIDLERVVTLRSTGQPTDYGEPPGNSSPNGSRS